MPQRRRRGLSGGAEGGLRALQQILAAMLQNRMITERQQDYVSAQNEALSERGKEDFERRAALAGFGPNASLEDIAAQVQQSKQAEMQQKLSSLVGEMAGLPHEQLLDRVNAGDPAARAFYGRTSPAVRQDSAAVERTPQAMLSQGVPDTTTPVADMGFVAHEKQTAPRLTMRQPLPADEIERRNAFARTRGAAEAQQLMGIGPYDVQEQQPFSSVPGGEAGLTRIQQLQQQVMQTDAFEDFQNTLTTALEVDRLANQADELIEQGQTQGVAQLDNQIATLIARSLETGRLTDQDIERVRPQGIDQRAWKDAVEGAWLKATGGQALLPQEREVLRQIAVGRFQNRGVPILESQIQFQLSPLESGGVSPEFLEYARQSLSIEPFIELVRRQYQGGGEAPGVFEEPGGNALDRIREERQRRNR